MDDTREPTHLRGIGAFGMIPEWLLVADISSTAKVLFGWMACKYANRSTWACWPGQGRLASDLNVSVKTIGLALKELVDVGALTKRQRMDDHGGPSTNYYQLMFLPSPQKLPTLPSKTSLPPEENFHTLPSKTSIPLPSKTADKPEEVEPEEREPERRASLIDSPLNFHKRHGGHITEMCDWVCLPEDMANQFARRAKMTPAQVLAWAQSVRERWEASGRVPTGSMWEFWNARWTEKMDDGDRDLYPNEGPVTRIIRLNAERRARMQEGR